jgi:hypothetical protein
MNEELLYKDCVIEHLIAQNFISPDPKERVSAAYGVSYYVINKNSMITFQFVEKTGQVFIPRSRIRILADLYKFNAEIIFIDCTPP